MLAHHAGPDQQPFWQAVAGMDSKDCCLWCKGPVTPYVTKAGLPRKGGKRFCSKACSKKAWDRDHPRKERRRNRPYSPGRSGRGPVLHAVCVGCGAEFSRQRSSSVDKLLYCTKECAYAVRKTKAIERAERSEIVRIEVRALRRIARYVERPKKTLRPCRTCGDLTIGEMERPRTCAACKNANRKKRKLVEKAKRRARERGATADRIDPLKVFARDKWTCHLCGCKTPAELRGTYEPNAPELDHIIPLAAGGTHTWSNVACCCRKCNIAKSDRPLGQLNLPIAA